ncbi:MAG: zinc ribbon domain-containing protein [Planctomycetes bacterium]|nr:zinc ribbon domain-containing protein [Planctomycetota bacterium]
MSEPERIRFCLECGEAMPYDDASCPACGASQPDSVAAPARELRPCRLCSEEYDAARLFCPRCGAERRAPPVLPLPAHVPPAGSEGRLPMLAAVLTLLGPLVLLAAVLAAYART